MSKQSEKNTKLVVDAIHDLMDGDADVGALLNYPNRAEGISVLGLINATLTPLGVDPLALMIDSAGCVSGVGIARKPKPKV